jgi:hypothetical protein
MQRFLISLLAAVATMACAGVSADELHQSTGFEKGHAGWLYQRQVTGIMWVDKTLGHKAPAIHHTQMFANGSMMFQTRANWLAPVKSGQPFRFEFDAKANVVNYLGSPTRREVVVEFRDYDNPPVDHPYTSVWTIVGYLDAVNLPGWRNWGVTVTDPTSAELPENWGGYGAEDELGNPFLPPGRTFANVLADADEIAITTFQPGWAYGSDHDFDVLYDNISVGVTGQ